MSMRAALKRVLIKPDQEYSSNDIPDLKDLKDEPLAPKLDDYRVLVEKKHLANLAENINSKSAMKKIVKTKSKQQEKTTEKLIGKTNKKDIENTKQGFEISD